MFESTYFTFDGTSSSKYDLVIAEINKEYIATTPFFSSSLSLSRAKKSKKFFHQGVNHDSPPTYKITILKQVEITLEERSLILSWLLGRNCFKKLSFDNAPEIYYNCVFTAADIVLVGGKCHGFTLTATFDSQYCYAGEVITEFIESGTDFLIDNTTDIVDDYIYPKVEFINRNEGFSASFSIEKINGDDSGRQLSLIGVQPKKTYIIDGERKIISCESGEEITIESCTFNLKWLRLQQGKNYFKVNMPKGCAIKVTFPNYKLIGF